VVKVGLALPAFDISTGRTTTLDDLGARAEAAERAGFDSVWVMDHFWSDRRQGRVGAHEPMVTLAYLAARTSMLRVGPLVLCNSFRHPGQLGREAIALADASGGRFILGLGAGWYRPEYEAFGFPFDHRVSRLEETVTVLRPLLRGDRVTYDGRYLSLRDASLVTTTDSPPLWIAAGGPRMMELTARHADGWNVAWYGPDTEPFHASLGELRAAMSAVGRPAGEIEVSVGLFVLPDPAAGPEDGRAIVGDAEHVAERIRAYGEAGADLVIVSLARNPFVELDPSYPARLAEVLRYLRRST
jgi:alkanesulfonate monooxygenase SsuD/methylene tetrahydromethanopterin reductase-like flavin-dependent oxidoreductase (luciferase family)